MKKTVCAFFVVLLIYSCSNVSDTSPRIKISKVTGSDTITPGVRFSNPKTLVAAFVGRDSLRTVNWVKRQEYDQIVVDSTGKKSIESHVAVGYIGVFQYIDSLGKPVMDSTGKPKTFSKVIFLNDVPDTILWNVTGLDLDSLVKIKGGFNEKH